MKKAVYCLKSLVKSQLKVSRNVTRMTLMDVPSASFFQLKIVPDDGGGGGFSNFFIAAL